MEATLKSSIALANLFDLPASVKEPPRLQPVVTEDDCEYYSRRLDMFIKESNNHLSLYQPVQITYCSAEKVFKTPNERVYSKHTHLVFDPFNLTAETAGSFLFLNKVCGYLVFVDSVPYAPLVPHKTAVLQFMNYFGLVPDFVISSPHGLKGKSLENSRIRLSTILQNKTHELNDCHPRSKIRKILEIEIKNLKDEIFAVEKIMALSQVLG